MTSIISLDFVSCKPCLVKRYQLLQFAGGDSFMQNQFTGNQVGVSGQGDPLQLHVTIDDGRWRLRRNHQPSERLIGFGCFREIQKTESRPDQAKQARSNIFGAATVPKDQIPGAARNGDVCHEGIPRPRDCDPCLTIAFVWFGWEGSSVMWKYSAWRSEECDVIRNSSSK